MKFKSKLLCGLFAAAIFSPVSAADFPTKPIRLIVPYSPGGASDVTMRALSVEMAKSIGQPVVVENRPGAGGTIGSQEAARATPDGYTLLAANNGTHIVNPLIFDDLPYDAVKDFTPISLVAQTPLFIALNPGLGITTFGEFISYAKANPGKVTFASPGNAHTLAIEYLGLLSDVDFLVVRYKGPGQALTDTMGGHVDAVIDTGIAVLPQAQAGKVNLVAITSLERSETHPDLPAVAETYPGYEAVGTQVLFAGGQIPDTVAGKLTNEVLKAMDAPAVRKTIIDGSGMPVGGDAEAARKWLADNTALWTSVLEKTNAVLE